MVRLQHDLKQLGANLGPVSDTSAAAARTTGRTEAYAELVTVARRADIGFIRALALLLKWETEHQIGAGNAETFGVTVLLSEWPVAELRKALAGAFDDDDIGDPDRFQLLVTELRLLGLDRVATDSDALAYFEKQHGLTRRQTAEADAATRARYDTRKQDWLSLNEALGDLCLMREDRIVRAEGLRQEFMQVFALEFLEERAQQSRLEIARMRLDLVREHPELSADEVEEQLLCEIRQRQAALARQQLSAVFGLVPGADVRNSDAPEDLATAKHLLRRLTMMIHPDRLGDLPLTDAQRSRLTELWHDTHRIRVQPGDRGLLCRSNEALRRNIRQAEQILSMAGIADLDPATTIHGETLGERIDWLDGACDALEARVTSIQAELFALGSDQELGYMRALLNSPASVQEEERASMTANAARLCTEAEACEAEARDLLAQTS